MKLKGKNSKCKIAPRFLLFTFAFLLLPLNLAKAATGCSYPSTLDAFVDIADDGTWRAGAVEDPGNKKVSYNRLECAVEKVEIELGLLPKGTYATVRARLDDAVYFTPAQSANRVVASPDGISGVLSVRLLVANDIPGLPASKITSAILALARGGTGADLSATGGAGQFVKQLSAGGALSIAAISLGELPAVLIDAGARFDNSLCVDGEFIKKAAGVWSCQPDATGGSPNWNTILNPVSAQSLTMGANNTTWTFDSAAGVFAIKFTSIFTTGPQFLIQQVTGNPTGGILGEFRAGDPDVIVLQAGDGTNGVTVTQPGVLAAIGAGQVKANRTICDATNPLLRFDGACTTAGGSPAWNSIASPIASQSLTMGANSTLWTFDNLSGKFEADFTSAFTTGSQWLIQQITGNPTGGVLFEIKVADTDVMAARFGDGTNYLNISKTGATTAVGTASITATILALASNPANCSAGNLPRGIDTAGVAEGCAAVSLTADVTGTLPVANGGSGAATLTGILKGNGTSAFSAATVGTDYGTPDASTKTLTNTTLDAEATGNVLTIPVKISIPFGGCNNATAGPVWDLPTSSAASASCVTGTNIQKGVLTFADGQSAQTTILLPSDWSGAIDVNLILAGGGSDTSGTVIPTIATACTATGGTTTDNPSFNAADNLSTITLATAANRVWSSTKTSIATTGCSAGNLLHMKMGRATDTAASAAQYILLELTYRRAI